MVWTQNKPMGKITRILKEANPETNEAVDHSTFTSMFDAFAESNDMDIIELPEGVHLYSYGSGSPYTFIVSGQHGDERAGPLALLEMARDGEFIVAKGTVRVCPIVSPESWDEYVRAAGGRNSNREWGGPHKTHPQVKAMMAILEEDPPDVFLDLHESDAPMPVGKHKLELRHAGTAWGKEMLVQLGPDARGVAMHSHIPYSAETYAHNLGIPATAAVETNSFNLELQERIELHKSVVRLAIGR